MINRLMGVFLVIVGISLFLLIPTLYKLNQTSTQISETLLSNHVTSAGVGETVGESYVRGEDVVSLAYKAANGEFILMLDGIQIDSLEGLELVNLRNVATSKYNVTKTDVPALNTDLVIATVRW